ncbi:aspartate aminotransferase family protein [Oceanicella actignis]|uniref:Acetylornithine aminotransferase n=1 Tax=Oceanicella actignis TaxID=1189325 RepID=A0A1M7RZK8_9RHOB|nr:aspartate aminotransferase family protein [Oceanicella actignis]SES94896.1 acetylornithine/N-succinyldiaminopimelate aminotransferase [Oceanicella actignis]SHN51606.1 acetylornithine/N-succinyldiaminopimelate aminotransferase [Oceanicella actignis]
MISPVLPTYARAPLSFVEGSGPWLIDESGRRHLDLCAGIAVNALGHAHPRLVAALESQARRLWHTSNLYRIPNQERLARRLTEATFADTVFFANSGTETIELAIKMARRRAHAAGERERTRILTFEGCFHGRSTGAIAASGAPKMVEGFGPLMPGFDHAPWNDLEAARALVGPQTAAILVEPIQGEGGVRVADPAFLQGLRALADESGALLILDEIQTGVGRTGKLFAHEHYGIRPDIMTVAKGIGGGFPLGALLATEEAAAAMTAGSHGSTYGGNPLACAVGCAVMDEVLAEGFLDRVAEAGRRLRAGLEALAARHPAVLGGVRGMGLMLGLECRVPVGRLVAAGYDAGVLVAPAAQDVARVLPPLIIADEEIDEGLARLEAAAAALEAAEAKDQEARA